MGGSEVEGEAMDTAESAESGCSKEVPKSLPSSLEADGSEGQRGDDSGTAKKTPVHPFFGVYICLSVCQSVCLPVHACV